MPTKSTTKNAIEESDNKLTAVLLGVLSAGASFLATAKEALSFPAKIGLTIIVTTVVVIGLVVSRFRARARKTTRGLLIRVERALGFWEQSFYIDCDTLYGGPLQEYPSKGWWLGIATSASVVPAGVGFLILLWGLTTSNGN